MTYDRTVLSLGAGTQSSALLMLALRGELPDWIPPLDAAIFADTGDEPKQVYDYLAVLERECGRYGVPLYVVNGADGIPLSEWATSREPKADNLGIPAFIKHDDGTQGLARRRCTGRFKIAPIKRQVRELLGGKTHGKTALQLIGMSFDEVSRLRTSDVGYIKHAWPLVDMRWRRQQSIDYLRRIGLPDPPRSACVYCPYRSNAEWRWLRDNDPQGWQHAIEVDRKLREANRYWEAEAKRQGRKLGAYNGDLYVHRQMVPLEEADLSTEEDHGQLPLWENECEGMCGA